MPQTGLFEKQAGVPRPSSGPDLRLSVSTCTGEKLLEGQVIQLEDGTTAYIHQVTVQKGECPRHPSLMEARQLPLREGWDGIELQRKASIALLTEPLSFEDGQPVQLEDGSMAYIHRTPKGGVTVITTGGRKGGRIGRGWGIAMRAGVPKLTRISRLTYLPWCPPSERQCLPPGN